MKIGAYITGGILGIILIFAVSSSWVLNIVKLVECDFEAPYKAEIIRSIGVPVPIVGVVVGYMDIGK